MKKIALLVPDGVGIRNYLYSNLLTYLKETTTEVFIWTPLPKQVFEDIEGYNDLLFYKINLEKESFISRICRASSTYARLLFNYKKTDNKTILTNWNYYPKSNKQKILNKVAQFIGKWGVKKYSRILMLEKKIWNNWDRKIIDNYKKMLQEAKIDTLVITHQRVASLLPICIAAKELGVEVVTVIYSWDNLPKASLAVWANKYLVWSNYMKEEMKMYYPEIQPENIIVTGTPQFEFYLNEKNIISREEFAKKYGLNCDKKWICFSGDDEKTSPFDPKYLEDVAEAIQKIEEKNRPQIIFRRCPVDVSGRYDKIVEQYKNDIIAIEPLWNIFNAKKNWGAIFPKKEDINLQVNLAYHCELVINLGSTMAHDFAIFDKPCFYLNYNPVEEKNTTWKIDNIYKFQHFKSIGNLEAVGWLNSKEEIQHKLQNVLKNNEIIGKDKKQWLQIIVKHPIEESSKNIFNLLK